MTARFPLSTLLGLEEQNNGRDIATVACKINPAHITQSRDVLVRGNLSDKKKFDVPLIFFKKSLRGTPLSDNL